MHLICKNASETGKQTNVMYRSIPKPPIPSPGQTPEHLTFLKNFGQIPRYVASLDSQMPHPLELQRGSNPQPSRHVKATVETSSAKFSATTNFLLSLSSLHTFNKKQNSTIKLYKTTKTEKPTWNLPELWPVNAAHVLNHCEILLLPTADRRFDTKVKCPTGWASFWNWLVHNTPMENWNLYAK